MAIFLSAFVLAKKEHRHKAFRFAKNMLTSDVAYDHVDEIPEKDYLENIVSLAPRSKCVMPKAPDEEWAQSLIDSFDWRKCTEPNAKALIQQWNESRAKHFLRMSITYGKPVFSRAIQVEDAGMFSDLLSKETLKKTPSVVPLDALSFLYEMRKGFRSIVHMPKTAVTSIDAYVNGGTSINGNSVMICRKPSLIKKRTIDGFAKEVALIPQLIAAKKVYHLAFSN